VILSSRNLIRWLAMTAAAALLSACRVPVLAQPAKRQTARMRLRLARVSFCVRHEPRQTNDGPTRDLRRCLRRPLTCGFAYHPPGTSGLAHASLCGSTYYDTVLSALSGCGGAQLVCDDDSSLRSCNHRSISS